MLNRVFITLMKPTLFLPWINHILNLRIPVTTEKMRAFGGDQIAYHDFGSILLASSKYILLLYVHNMLYLEVGLMATKKLYL